MDQFSVIANMVRDSERHADDLATDRVRAMEYYRGEMKDTPSDEGRSSMVTRDVRAQIKKVLPSITRTILGGADVVEYMPVGMNDEAGAEQATDYVNRVVFPECDGARAVYDAVHDALLLRNGILKWCWDERKAVKISRHTGLTDDALAELAGDDEVEIVEHSETVEDIDGMQVALHDVKIRRTYMDRKISVAAVPRERFLIHPDALSLDDSLLTGEKSEVRRGELIAMGYDRDLVDGLSSSDDDEYEESVRRDTVVGDDEAQRANDEIDYYDLYIRVDLDGDGIAELRHMVFAGGLKEQNLLVNEECDEVQYADIKVMSQPHQWEGISLFDDLSDIQQAKTVLLRQTLDNIYWQNNPQPMMQKGAVMNPDAVYNPEFGLPIEVRDGTDIRAAIGFAPVPFMARDSFGMMDYLDNEATDRTGVSDASSGLAPDALQNMTAKASAMIEQAGIGQTEMMVRTVAEGLRKFFRGLLRLIIRHQDVPRTVRLRDEWVTFDPRDWNSDMDCTVNTGLGAGTRERDMLVMQQVLGLQEKLLSSMGADNPFVKPENLYASLAKLVESAGLKTPGLYFTEPDPEEIKDKMDKAAQKPSPEQIKVQAQMQIEQMKQQTQAAKEKAQMEADLVVKRAEIEAETKRQANELASKAAIEEQRIAWEREKFAAEMAMKREEMAQRRVDDALKAQADRIAPHLVAAQ
ncbi:MAG: phage portal protein [Sphingomonadales bacterium]|nr:MAG: phage portal protein [Sphingomonadales bacterium]